MGILTDINKEIGDPMTAIWGPTPYIKYNALELFDIRDQVMSSLTPYLESILMSIPSLHDISSLILKHQDMKYYIANRVAVSGYGKMSGYNWVAYNLVGYGYPMSSESPLSGYHKAVKDILRDLNQDPQWRYIMTKSVGSDPASYIGVQAVEFTFLWNPTHNPDAMKTAKAAIWFGTFNESADMDFQNIDNVFQLNYSFRI